MRTRRILALIWLCFVARLAFYAAMLPLWEGYDEWAHFAVVRRVAGGEILVSREARIQQDVQASLDLAPVPYELRRLPPPAVIQDDFWRLPESERARRAAAFAAMPESWRAADGRLAAYEALQPPLYYWIAAPALKLAPAASLGAQVMLLRWLSCLIGSAAIPLVFLIGRAIFADDSMALACAAVAAIMPGFAIDLARVGNECVGVVLFSALIWLVADRRAAAAVGCVLGLGLLAKAYFLTAVPAMAVLLMWDGWRGAARPAARRALTIFGIAGAIAGWWYVRNLVATGTLSGLSEAVMLRGMGAGAMIARAAHINWLKAIDGILLSHIYFGGWSSLTARSWMYHVFYLMIAAAAVGLARGRRTGLEPAATFYAFFWIGQMYNVVLLYLSKGVAVSMGWYLYAVIGAEIAVCAAGLRLWRRVLAAGVVLLGLLDFYTVHALAMPYYAGIVAHKANGGIAGLHRADPRVFAQVFSRLAMFKGSLVSPPVVAVSWAGYFVATVLLITIALRRIARNHPKPW